MYKYLSVTFHSDLWLAIEAVVALSAVVDKWDTLQFEQISVPVS